MKRWILAVLMLLGVLLAGSLGCKAQEEITPGPTPKQTGPDVIVNNADLPPEHIIEVAGYGEVIADPDYATLTFSVSGAASTAEEASALCETNLQSLYDVAIPLGVRRVDIKATGAAITAQVRESDGAITGYSAVNTVTITASDVSTANTVVSGIVDASVSELKSVTYSITDTTAAYQKALVSAMEDAASKAGTVAEAAGVQLGAVIGVAETPSDDSKLVGVDFETSDIAVPAWVTVRYLIK